jgi:uncharacterized membrane protein YecN with MAPEG domain
MNTWKLKDGMIYICGAIFIFARPLKIFGQQIGSAQRKV